jgi:hypothetical protein
MLKDRVSALREANIYEPQRYRYVLAPIRILDEAPGSLEVEANFLVVPPVAMSTGWCAPAMIGNSP